MQVKMSTVLNLKPLYTKIKDKTFSIKTTYKFSKFFSSINKENDFYSEQLNNLIQKYAERDADGNLVPIGNDGVKLKKEYVEIAQKEVNELLDLDVELPDIKFSLEELEPGNFTIDEFNELIPFIEE